jgi:hypothetical protein
VTLILLALLVPLLLGALMAHAILRVTLGIMRLLFAPTRALRRSSRNGGRSSRRLALPTESAPVVGHARFIAENVGVSVRRGRLIPVRSQPYKPTRGRESMWPRRPSPKP